MNVDDAMDDIVRQFKGVSDGLMRKVVGSTSPTGEIMSSISSQNLFLNAEEISKHVSWQDMEETTNSFSDNEEGLNGSHDPDEVGSSAQANGWHSDNELNSKSFPPRVIKQSRNLGSIDLVLNPGVGQGRFPATEFQAIPSHLEDPVGMPPEVL